MKKLFLLSLILFATPLFAQLNVISQQEKVEKIGMLRSTYAYVFAQGTDYYLGIRSSNQFDDTCLFCLGGTASSSIMTARDLIKVANSLEVNASVVVTDARGVKAQLIKKKIVGQPYLDILLDGQAGTSNITAAELEKAIDIIKKHSGVQEGNIHN